MFIKKKPIPEYVEHDCENCYLISSITYTEGVSSFVLICPICGSIDYGSIPCEFTVENARRANAPSIKYLKKYYYMELLDYEAI